MRVAPGVPFALPAAPASALVLALTLAAAGSAWAQVPDAVLHPSEAARTTAAALEGFDEWILAHMESWVVPGMAIGIVSKGEVVYARGFGLRDVEKGLPVTTSTLFAIGSASKAFTALGVGLLVDDGRVDFDEPVGTYLPGLRLHDPVATLQLTPRDMLSHRSGLPRHDLAWYNSDGLTPDSLVKVLAHFEPNRELRERWQYNNMMFVTAGHLIAELSGTSWEAFTRARILEPLGMRATNFHVGESRAAPDHATPYGEEDDAPERLPFRDISNVGPAGSINSNVDDMVKWVGLQLGGGEWQGTRIVESSTLDEMHTPQMVIASKPSDAMLGPQSYGLGWFIDTYRGHFRVRHGGNIDGFSALVALFPHDSLGMVALSNKNGTPMPEFAVRRLADQLLGLEPRDWSGEALERAAAAEARADSLEAAGEDDDEAPRVEGTSPSFPLEAYAGAYEHPGYGRVDVELDAEGTLHVRYNRLSAPLGHWHFDVFETLENPEDAALEGNKLQFLMDVDGRIEAVRIRMEPAVGPIVFVRLGDPRLEDPEYLAALVGSYELPDGTVVEVTLSGTVLTVTVPGQPPYRLEPQQDDTFGLEGLDGYRVRFDVEDGEATGLTFLQPNGTFRARRR